MGYGVLNVEGSVPKSATAAEGDSGNAASSAVATIPLAADAAAQNQRANNSEASGNAITEAKNMNSLSGAGNGKVETGAKNASNKDSRKDKTEEQKKEAKRFFTKGKCFAGDTLVYTKKGLRPIREIREGDDIYSRNMQTGETAVRKVEEVFQTEAHTIYHIWLDGKEELKTTAYHPLFVKKKGWVNAINLREGYVLETLEGTALVTKIKKIRHEEPVEVFNFHVEEWESYFVSERKVYVHNGDGHVPKAFEQKEFGSTEKERLNKTPGPNNRKVEFKQGDRGNSKCTLKPPPDKELQKIFEEAGIDGIEYKNAVPDFSPVCKCEVVEIDMSIGKRQGEGSTYSQANNIVAEELNNNPKLAAEWGICPKNGKKFTASDVNRFMKQNDLVWHELNDLSTMQMVPKKVNSIFGHLGGISESKKMNSLGG